MMNFILPFHFPKAEKPIGYHDRILCMGSCFAQEIGQMMDNYKLDILINPHGIVYNSISIAQAITEYTEQKIYTTADLVQENNTWHSLNHHSSFSDPDFQKSLDKINTGISHAGEYLKTADWLCITLGSSWAYQVNATGKIAANCHKIPGHKFTKVFIDSGEQCSALDTMIKILQGFNPKLKILFTVSPVKYIRDGVIENTLSKAHLITTVNSLCNTYAHCFYFPAYELVTDVLRDYRFYKEDMVHPNEQAIQFVWEQFIQTYFEESDRKLIAEIGEWLKYTGHRVLHESGNEDYNLKAREMKLVIEEKISLLRTRNN